MDIEVLGVERLHFADGTPVTSASAVAPFGDGFLVVPDDASHAAWFRDGSATAVRMVPAVDGHELFTHAAASRFLEGTPIGPEASLNKVFWSEYDIALHETALDLLGESPDPAWSEGWVFALAGPIYAGTNEIQRDIIAERLLGLPKGRR